MSETKSSQEKTSMEDSSAGEKRRETESDEENTKEIETESSQEKPSMEDSSSGEKRRETESDEENTKEIETESSQEKPSMEDSSSGEKRQETESDEENTKDIETEIEEEENVKKPKWYRALMNARFNRNCRIHQRRRNFFCFSCCTAQCIDCVSAAHLPHPRIHVLKSLVGDDIVNVEDMSMFIDCSQIQVRLSAFRETIIRLKPSHQVKSIEECKKTVHRPAIFCSLSCKLDYVLDQEGDLCSVYKLEELGLADTPEDDQTVSKSCKVEQDLDQEGDLSKTKLGSENASEDDQTVTESCKVEQELDKERDARESHSFRKRPRKRTPTRSPWV
ncbi:PREDICTED: uncharacterized protein LOC104806218 [Tarenaya hassleriana]|uniref:uncharacterized protein LOC104806218 n=1 Tax=Tarenaya hassleriana TaxID=28532 RepID=UPI00053C0984|nr:PREDICTED: uncharacterized protein LOC104806218 [Tarenaya hassleriana]